MRNWRMIIFQCWDQSKNPVIVLIALLGIIMVGVCCVRGSEFEYLLKWNLTSVEWVGKQVEYAFVPQLATLKYQDSENEDWIIEQALNSIPILKVYADLNVTLAEESDTATEEWILLAQAMDENAIDEDGTLIGEEVVLEPTTEDYTITIDMETITDLHYVLSNYYVYDSTVNIDESIFNMTEWIEADMSLEENVEGPQILIYHTHSQEAFVDSVEGDMSTTIVGVGAYLAEVLEEEYGVEVLHHDGVYDLVDGVLDRSTAYELSCAAVEEILEEYPSIEFIIDLHRDGVNEDTHLVTMIDGEPTAQIMFFNGLSSTITNGSISSLYNPYIEDNLALTFQMQLAAEELYPGFSRRIYLRSYRYNLHLLPKTMLIEAGAQTNTLEEMFNAMDVLAELLSKVLNL